MSLTPEQLGALPRHVLDKRPRVELQMSDKTELLPCPFCGGVPQVRMIGNDHTKSRKVTIRCPGCRIERTDAALRHGHDWLLKVATEHWNQRPAVAPADAVRDSERLDWLEQMGNEPEGLLLHAGRGKVGARGLGLSNLNRTLREAVDAAMRPTTPKEPAK